MQRSVLSIYEKHRVCSQIMTRLPVVIITGSSTGIGLELALALAKKPYTVVATLRNPEAATTELRATNCDIQALDVTCEKSVANLASHVKEKYEGCDIVINNAGFGIPGCLEAMSIDDAKRVFEVNVWGVMRMCQTFSPQMRDRGGGLILVVSSTSGVRGLPFSDIYVSSKQAVEGLMESYRYAVEQDNIKVAVVNPGPTATAFSGRFSSERREEAYAADPYKELTQHFIDMMGQRNSNGQSGEDCASSVVETLEREYPKKVGDGSENVKFWNPTSDYATKTITGILKYPDGLSGEYKTFFEYTRKVRRSLNSGNQAQGTF